MKTIVKVQISESQMNEIINRNSGKAGSLLTTLEEIQDLNPLKYLSKETLGTVARKMEVPYSQVYSVVTFYSYFNLMPQGKNTIIVCRGTACHTRGSKALLSDVKHMLGISDGKVVGEQTYTTPDNMFTIKTVACFGQCALSPVVSVNGVIHSNMNTQKLIKILSKVKSQTYEK